MLSINPFLHDPLVMMIPGSTDRGVVSGLILAKEKLMEAKASTVLGWYSKKAMLDYWNQILSDLHRACLLNQVNQILLYCCGDLLMKIVLLSLYLKNVFPEDKDGVVIKETGIWLLKDGDNQEWLGSSPDGIILNTIWNFKNCF